MIGIGMKMFDGAWMWGGAWRMPRGKARDYINAPVEGIRDEAFRQ